MNTVNDNNKEYEIIEREIEERNKFINAVFFQKLKGIFDDDSKDTSFNKFCENITDDILKLYYSISDYQHSNIKDIDVFEKLTKIDSGRQKSLINKVKYVSTLLNEKNGDSRFVEMVKLVLTNLSYGKYEDKYLRYSRNSNEFYSKNRFNYIKNYEVFIFIVDTLEIMSMIDNIVGDRKKNFESRMRLSDFGKKTFSIVAEPLRFDVENNGKLIILRKEITKVVNGKEKIIKVPIEYKVDKTIKRQLEIIKQINNIYNNRQIYVKAENLEIVSHNENNIIDDFFSFNLNNYINLIELVCETNSIVNYTNYYKELSNSTNSISITSRDYNLDTPPYLLMGVRDSARKDNYLGELKSNSLNLKERYYKFSKLSFIINRKSLHRVYSRGDWRYNGRWYGAFIQNMPKCLRKHIYLDDSKSPLVGLDYSGFHPRIAYHIQGIAYNDDPYIIKGYGKDYRDHFKIVTLIAMNAANWNEAVATIMKNLSIENIAHLTYAETSTLLKAFAKHHNKIKGYICSDFGITGMNTDSKIMEHLLYELMVKKGIVVLPVHDELLCSDNPEIIKIVKQQMIDSYRKIMEPILRKSGKLKKNEELPEDITPIVKMS